VRGRNISLWFQRCIVGCLVLSLSGLSGCTKPRQHSLNLRSPYQVYLPAVGGPPSSPDAGLLNPGSLTLESAGEGFAADQPVVTNSAEPLWELTPALNDVPLSEIIVLPEETLRTVREIYAAGQSLGNNPHAFSKIGDSTIESPFFMDRFDDGPYNLGEYGYLQKVINYYQGSFTRQGRAVYRGLHTWSMFDPAWADPDFCEPNETPIDCEFRLQHPSLVFIRVGSNDVGRSDLFRQNMTQLIELCFERGVIPIIGTKADRNEGSNVNNEMLRELAENYDVPLWDFDRVADTIPGRGMDVDGVHLTTFYAHDYTLPYALQTGYGVHNITALMMLYELWRNLPTAP
jgi:hypothetical protein